MTPRACPRQECTPVRWFGFSSCSVLLSGECVYAKLSAEGHAQKTFSWPEPLKMKKSPPNTPFLAGPTADLQGKLVSSHQLSARNPGRRHCFLVYFSSWGRKEKGGLLVNSGGFRLRGGNSQERGKLGGEVFSKQRQKHPPTTKASKKEFFSWGLKGKTALAPFPGSPASIPDGLPGPFKL